MKSSASTDIAGGGAAGSADDPRAALDALIRKRGIDYAYLSRLIGRNAAYVQQYIKRGTPRRLAEEDRARLAAYFGVSETLLGAPGAAPSDRASARRAGPAPPTRRDWSGDLVIVPQLAIGASAGPGVTVDGEGVDRGFAFDPRWLRRLGADPRALSMIRVEGDSMAPTLNDGDDILVDGSDGPDRLRDGIYVLRIDDMLMVKRIARGARRGRVAIVSDNPHYPGIPDMALADVSIVGRVTWAGRAVR